MTDALGTLNDVLAELRRLGGGKRLAGMGRVGINIEKALGVSVPELRKIAKRLGPDHDLAMALWKTGGHEARLLAAFLDDPAKVTPAQMDAWARDFDSWDVCDQACTSLFDQSRHAWAKAIAWAKHDDEWIKRGGFALMAGLAWHDKAATNPAFRKLLSIIERAAYDERNWVKKAVNWALRNIGKRNRALNQAALVCARRILAAADRRAGEGRGDASVRAARWIASDAIRELSSPKIRLRLRD